MVQAHTLCEERLALKILAQKRIDRHARQHQDDLSEYMKVWHRKNKIKKPNSRDLTAPSYYQFIPTDLMTQYAASDTAYTYVLHERQWPKVEAAQGLLDTYHLEIDIIPPLADMEEEGAFVNREALEKADEVLAEVQKESCQALWRTAGHKFDPGKNAQIYPIITKLGLPVLKTTKKTGKPSIDKATIQAWTEMGFPFGEHLMRWKQASKLRGNYIQKMLSSGVTLPNGVGVPALDEFGRLHCSFNSTGTTTGRLSSSQPNLQNIPRKAKDKQIGSPIRSAFEVPPEIRADGGFLLYVDYSQIEVRLAAHFSKDPLLLEAYLNGIDVHTLTAQQMFAASWASFDEAEQKRMRQVAKNINFMILYGGSHKRLMGILREGGAVKADGTPYTITECDRFVRLHRSTYRILNSWIIDARREAKKVGGVSTAFGRFRALPILKRQPKTQEQREKFAKAERQAVNTIVQGTAADLFKRAFVRVAAEIKRMGLRTAPCLNIHDELAFYAFQDEIHVLLPMLREQMEDFPQFCVPMKAEFSWSLTNWDEKKELAA